MRGVNPLPMLTACSLGMLAGLSIDCLSGPPGGLLALCAPGPQGLATTAWHHLQALPAMHALMLLGGMAVVPLARGWQSGACLSIAFNTICNFAMLAGMMLGGWAGALAPHAWATCAMFFGMAVGMVAGMALMLLADRAMAHSGIGLRMAVTS